jgi:hypothetical protein
MVDKKKLTKKQLIARLNKLEKSRDTESAHCEADALLVEFIDDRDIADAYNRIHKWYA